MLGIFTFCAPIMSARIGSPPVNSDLFLYKTRFISFVLLFGYTFLHTRLTVIYVQVTLDQMLGFCARMPFAQRLLVPALAKLLSDFLPFSAASLFFCWNFCSLQPFFQFTSPAAYPASPQNQLNGFLAVFAVTAIALGCELSIYVWRAGDVFLSGGYSISFLYEPGFLLCLQKRWPLLLLWIFLATFNRESSILLVLLIPALHWKDKTSIKPFIAGTMLYILARLIILFLTRSSPGPLTEWYDQYFGHTYFETNFNWLFRQMGIFLISFCFMGLPLPWFAFIDYIPLQLRPIRFIAVCYFLGLLLIGNFPEVRIFHEIVILLYLPVCMAIYRWIKQEPPFTEPAGSPLLYFLNRYAVSLILLIIIMAHSVLAPLVSKVADLSGSKNSNPLNKDWYDKYYNY